jgi:hypothetical protein
MVVDTSGPSNKAFLVGGKTQDNLTGALLDCTALGEVEALDEKQLADGGETLVAHDLEGVLPHGLLFGFIPIGAENTEILYQLVMLLRSESHKAGYTVVHASGDGAAANIAALEAVKESSKGTSSIVLSNLSDPSEVYKNK